MQEEQLSQIVDAILANDELMNKLAAKILDRIEQRVDIDLWNRKLKSLANSLDMELEEGLAESAVTRYPVTTHELGQVLAEIRELKKTVYVDEKKLTDSLLSRAVNDVLARNALKERQECMKYYCPPYRYR